MSIYTLHHQVRRLDEELCGNGRKYSTGDVLFSDRGKRIVLGKTIAEGGEGSVFAVHSESEASLVAKLYHSSQRVRWREQKLRLMCSRPIRSPCVAWPREILYDELRRFVGVLMPRADVVPLGSFAFHAEQLKKQFPSWPRYDLTRLCLNLSESVHTLHRYGVVLGDLHPGKVMEKTCRQPSGRGYCHTRLLRTNHLRDSTRPIPPDAMSGRISLASSAILGHNLTCVQRRDLRPRAMPGYLVRCLQQYLRDMAPGGRRDHPMYRDLLHDRPCPPNSLLVQMTSNICTDCGILFREAPDDVARRLRQSHARPLCRLCIRRRRVLNQAFRNSIINH